VEVLDMTKTKIFIASAAEDFKIDNYEIETFISRLNNCYVDRGLYFTPVLSVDMSDAESRNMEITDSSVAFFLLNADTNADIGEIYKAARSSYNKTGNPKISVYIKTSSANTQDNTKLLREKLGGGAELHYNTYSHVDTLKLGILMQVKQLDLPGVDVRLENGKAWQGSDALLSLENVESVTGYENLQSLKQKRAELESRYYAAKTKYAENPDDTAAYDEFFEVSKQRSDAIQEISEIESQLYNMIEGMYIQTSQGKLSKRQAESYRLIERGKLLEAKTILDFDEIVSDGRKKDEAVKQAAQEAQILVSELLQLKDLNATLLDWEAVDACYREAVRLEEKHNLPWRAAITLDPTETDYMNLLIMQYRLDEAVKLGERLLSSYQNPVSELQREEKSYLLNLLGIIYDETQQMAKAEEALKESLTIRNTRTDGESDAIAKDIAIVYNNLGNVFIHSKRFNEAIETHKSALEIRKKLAIRNPSAYEEYLAYTYFNLSEVYCAVESYEESSELMIAARDIFSKLAAIKPDPFEEYLSQSYHGLGVAYTRLQLYTEAEKHFIAALEIQLRQMENNPGIYEARVAANFQEHGRMCFEAKRYLEAEEKLKVALKLYDRLANRTPDAFEPELAKCYATLGELYKEAKRFDESIASLNSAIRLYEKYKDSNPAFTEKMTDVQKLLTSVVKARQRSEGTYALLTPDEKEVALLLTDGATKSEISRKLHISAAEVGRIVNAIRDKMVGRTDPDPILASVIHEFNLTRREADMLRYLQQNAGNDEIAAELFLSSETVKVHVRNLLKKISVENRISIADWLEDYEKRL